jgi:hypothetical protein
MRGHQRGPGQRPHTAVQTALVAFVALLACASAVAAPVDPATADVSLTPDRAEDVAGQVSAADPEGASDLPSALTPEVPTLTPPPRQLGDVLEIAPDPPPGVNVALPPAVAGLSGCGLVGAPLGTLGFTSAILGVAAVVGVLGAGLNPLIGVPLFLGSFCVGVPSFCVMGPATVGAGAGGAMIATRKYNNRSGIPGLIAMIPPLLLAFAGSALATVGIFYTIGALLAISPGQGRAGLAMLSGGLLTSLLAGPLAAFLAVGADLAFGGPFEEGLSGSLTDMITGPADGAPTLRSDRAAKRPAIAMAY